MGAYAPPLGVLAGTVTEMQEYAASPNPIAQENFELNYAQTGYTGVDTGLPQDYTGSGSAVTAESEFPHQLPYTYQK
jgi:hypothetical protein